MRKLSGLALVTSVLLATQSGVAAQDRDRFELRPTTECNAAPVEGEGERDGTYSGDTADSPPHLIKTGAAADLAEGPTHPALFNADWVSSFRLTYACGRASKDAPSLWNVVAVSDQEGKASGDQWWASPAQVYEVGQDRLIPLAALSKEQLKEVTSDNLAKTIFDRSFRLNHKLALVSDGGVYRVTIRDIRYLFGDEQTLKTIDCLSIPLAIVIDHWSTIDFRPDDPSSEHQTEVVIPLIPNWEVGRTESRSACERPVWLGDKVEPPLSPSLYRGGSFYRPPGYNFGNFQYWSHYLGLFDRNRIVMIADGRKVFSLPWRLSSGDTMTSTFLVSISSLERMIEQRGLRSSLKTRATLPILSAYGHDRVPPSDKDMMAVKWARDEAQSEVDRTLSAAAAHLFDWPN